MRRGRERLLALLYWEVENVVVLSNGDSCILELGLGHRWSASLGYTLGYKARRKSLLWEKWEAVAALGGIGLWMGHMDRCETGYKVRTRKSLLALL
jgi:hypothetical protein